MVSRDFACQLEGYGLTTASILYRMPDHRSILQEFIWQEYDLAPRFPEGRGGTGSHHRARGLDSAGTWHTAAPPPGCAGWDPARLPAPLLTELQPAEHLWPALDEPLANQYFATLADPRARRDRALSRSQITISSNPAHHARGDARGVPVHPHHGSERLKPEGMGQAPQKLVPAIVMHDRLTHHGAKSSHSVGEPLRHMPAM